MRVLRLIPLLLLTVVASARTADSTLRVLVYNIHAGRDAKGIDNLERVAQLVASTKADLVLLQEVDRKTKRSGNLDHFAILETLTKMNGVFGKALDFQGGEYGIAILSRWPISASEIVPMTLDSPAPAANHAIEPRIALIADIKAPGGAFRIVNTHFDASGEDSWRHQEVEQLVQLIKARKPAPQLVGGDFNSTPDSEVHERMQSSGVRDSWPECGGKAALTYPADIPVKKIDYLYLAKGWKCSSAAVLESQASDHRPVLIIVRRPLR